MLSSLYLGAEPQALDLVREKGCLFFFRFFFSLLAALSGLFYLDANLAPCMPCCAVDPSSG